MRKKLLAILTTGLLATGCATSGTPMTSNTAPLAPIDEGTTIAVQNHNWSDIVVYAVRHTQRVRLGMVTSMNARTFELPESLEVAATEVQLLASPIGSRDEYMTGPIHFVPGQTVELRLENLLAISNWSVW